MKDKIFNIVSFCLFLFSFLIFAAFIIVFFSGLLDVVSVLVTLGTGFIEFLFIGCLYLLKDKS